MYGFKVVPHRSLSNKGMIETVKQLHDFKSIWERKEVKGKRITLKENRIAYEIVITKDNASFNLYSTNENDINVLTKNLPECTIEHGSESLSCLQTDIKNIKAKELELKHHYFLSLNTSTKELEPIRSILDVQSLLEEDDTAIVQYILEPESYDWSLACSQAYSEFKNGKMPKVMRLNKKEIANTFANGVASVAFGLSETIQEFILSDSKDVERFSVQETDVARILRDSPLSSATMAKSKGNAFMSTIRVLSISNNSKRSDQITKALGIAFRTVSGDNFLIEKDINVDEKFLKLVAERKASFSFVKNILSTEEVAKLMLLPQAELQDEFRLDNVKMKEVQIPEVLQSGENVIGTMKRNGKDYVVYWEDKYNIITLPKIVVGGMGGGKSEYTANFVVNGYRGGAGAVVFDFIKECEVAEKIESLIPKEDLVVLDLSDDALKLSFDFSEISVKEGMSVDKKKEISSDLADQTLKFVSAINDGSCEELTGKMTRPFYSLCVIVYSLGYKRIYDVIRTFTDHNFRMECIDLAIEKGIFEEDDYEVINALTINEIDKATKEVIGTKENAMVNGILDRLDILIRKFRLRQMLEAEPSKIDFVKYMNESKVVLIKIRESVFHQRWIKDLLVTYLLSRVWLATLLRGKQEKPNVCNVVTDEIHQLSTAVKLIEEHITEGRKFGLAFYFTCQYLNQFRSLLEGVRGAGCSIMLLSKGTYKANFDMVKDDLKGFDYEELRTLEKYHSLNLIQTSQGSEVFISKLPKPIDVSIKCEKKVSSDKVVVEPRKPITMNFNFKGKQALG